MTRWAALWYPATYGNTDGHCQQLGKTASPQTNTLAVFMILNDFEAAPTPALMAITSRSCHTAVGYAVQAGSGCCVQGMLSDTASFCLPGKSIVVGFWHHPSAALTLCLLPVSMLPCFQLVRAATAGDAWSWLCLCGIFRHSSFHKSSEGFAWAHVWRK